MAAAAPYLMAMGGVMGAVGAIRQGQAASAAADYNAQVASQNAQITDAQSASASQAQQRDAQRHIGAAVAAYGASGVQLSDGSPSDVLAESARNATLDNLTLKYNYNLRKQGFLNQVSLNQAESNNDRTSSYFAALGSMMGAGSKMAQYYGSSGSSVPQFG